jgi:hypothetical protein
MGLTRPLQGGRLTRCVDEPRDVSPVRFPAAVGGRGVRRSVRPAPALVGDVLLSQVGGAPAYARFSFATTVHVAELGAAVRRVEPCASTEAAASLAARSSLHAIVPPARTKSFARNCHSRSRHRT